MKLTVNQLRTLIEQTVVEVGELRGGLRKAGDSKGRKFKIGKVEDENRELSFSEAELLFPESTEAWAEIVPEYFPDFPFATDPLAVKRNSLFFKEGEKLTVACIDFPQITLATWDSRIKDWILTDDLGEAFNRGKR
jgi:hypothetical protein